MQQKEAIMRHEPVRSTSALEACWTKFEGASFFASPHGNVETIVSHGGVGQIQYQCDGTRLVATASLSECLRYLSRNLQAGSGPKLNNVFFFALCLASESKWLVFVIPPGQEAIQMFEAISSQSDKLQQFRTLSTGCLSSGDVMMLPAGYVLIQKSVNCDTIGLRVNSHLLCHDAIPGRNPETLSCCHCNAVTQCHGTDWFIVTVTVRTGLVERQLDNVTWLTDQYVCVLSLCFSFRLAGSMLHVSHL